MKQNAPELLEDALSRRRRRAMIGTGSMCDPYQPIEKKLRLTRRCLEVIDKYGFGATVLTKSDSLLQDIDLFERINQRSRFVAQMTLTTFDKALCSIIEPRVSSTYERYLALKALSARGIPTVVWLCPTLPYINDTEENLRGILDYCFDAGVNGILSFGFGLTLREGDREYFYEKLDAHFPGLKARYERRYGTAYELESDNSARLWEIFDRECKKRGVICRANEVFDYLNFFEERPTPGQLSMF